MAASAHPLPRFDQLSFIRRVLLHWSVWRVTRQHDRSLGVEIVPIRSIGVVGDAQSYEPTVFLNPRKGFVFSSEHLGSIATDIVNRVPGIGRVLVDVTPLQKGGSS